MQFRDIVLAAAQQGAAAGSPIRGSNSVFVNSANTATVPLPAGASVNDTLAISVGHSWALNGLTWSDPSNVGIQNLQGANYNGLTYYGKVVAADISRGYIGFSFAGVGYGIISLVCFVGTKTFITSGGTRSGTGAASRTVPTDASAPAGSLLLLMGSAYLATDATSSSLSNTLIHNQNANASGVCRYGIAATTGIQSGTVNYAGSPGGDYQVIVAFAP